MNRTKLRSAAPAAAAITLALGLSACGAANEGGASDTDSDLSGTLSGAGASSQESAVQAWQAGFQTQNPDVTVNYDPIGSGGGREQFIAGGTAFAGSDAYLEDEELDAAIERCSGGNIVEVPVYVSPIAIIYNLPGVDELNLTPEALGGIFAGDITTWNDPAIADANPDAELPDTRITPVHRSDASGTTENFTEYLDAVATDAWGQGVVEEWPIDGGEAANGTSGVVSAVSNGEGTIGYADASQAGDLSTAAVQVGEEFVNYSPEAAAAVIDASERVEGRSETDLAVEVDRQIDEPGVYPVVLVSYAIACQEYEDAETAELVKAYLSYVVSSDGQQAAADGAGSAPLSDEFASEAQTAIDTITGP